MKNPETKFSFMKYTLVWFVFSAMVLSAGIGSAAFKFFQNSRPFNLGIDFTGGTALTIRFEKLKEIQELNPSQKTKVRTELLKEVRTILAEFGFSKSEMQVSDKDLLLRLQPISTEERSKIIEALEKNFQGVELVESDTIGPTIGKELRGQALWMIFLVLVAMTVYISFRFEFWYGLAAILALAHDALATLGIASILHIEVNIPFTAAILTILGYSINDTIVIFDRIRENVKNLKREKFINICDLSIIQTLTRSINTVLTTLLTVLALLIFGGTTIKDFTLTLLIGIGFGCYSSIFIASPLLVIFKKWQGVE